MKTNTVVIAVANILAAVLGSLAATNTFPALSGLFGVFAGIIAGAVNVNKPGTAAKIAEAKAEVPE